MKKNGGKSGFVVSACFLTVVFSLGVCFLFAERREFSDAENRPLVQPPALFADGTLNTRFYYELERFFNDAFPFRDGFLALNKRLESMYALIRPDDGVAFVYLNKTEESENRHNNEAITPDIVTDTQSRAVTATDAAENAPPVNTPPPSAPPVTENPPAVKPEEPEESVVFTSVPIVGDRAFELFEYDENSVTTYAEIINELSAKAGVPVYIIHPPSASELYLPEKYRNARNEQRPAFELLNSLLSDALFIDLSDAFSAAKDEYVYFRTDHHWTADGAYIAYAAFCEAAGLVPAELSDMRTGRTDGFLGSMYKAVSQSPQSDRLKENPDYVEYYYPVYDVEIINYTRADMVDGTEREVVYPDYDRDSNLYNIFFGGEMALSYMRSDIGNGKSIMVVRDSFGHAFLPFLANHYEHVYAIEPRCFAAFDLAGFIAEHGIEELLFVGYSLPVTSDYWQDGFYYLEALK